MRKLLIPDVGPCAVGLHWEGYPPGKDDSIEALRIYAESIDDVTGWAIHTAQGQVSLGFVLNEETELGLISLAALLSGVERRSWIAIFEFPEGYWLAASKNKQPHPMADKWFDTLDEAEAEMAKIRALFDFDMVMLPYGGGDIGFIEANLDFFDLTDAEQVIVRPLEESLLTRIQEAFVLNRKKALKIAGAAAVSVVLVAGYTFYSQTIAAEEERVAAEARAARRDEEKKEALEIAKDNVRAQWVRQSLPSQMASQCRDALIKLNMPFAGWSSTDWKCDGTQVRAHFVRKFGPNRWLERRASELGLTVSYTGINRAEVFVKWDAEGLRDDVDLMTSSNVNDALAEAGRANGFTVVLNQKEEADKSNIFDKPLWRASVKFEKGWNVEALATELDKVPGFVVTKMSRAAGRTGAWILDGVIYYGE